MKKADVDDRGFEQLDVGSSPSPDSPAIFFPKLKDLDLETTRVNRDVLLETFTKSNPSKTLDFDLASIAGASPPQDEGVIKVMVGKRVIREAWEIEADRRARMRSQRSAGNLRASAAEQDADVPPLPLSSSVKGNKAPPAVKVAPVKEQWEIEAEMGLLTEGGKRRARALAAAASEEHEHEHEHEHDDGQRIVLGHASAKNALAKYYDDRLKTLTLPPVSPPSRAHGRGFSLAAPFNNKRQGSGEDLGVPVALAPLYLIVKQGWWEALRVLELKGRRADPCFVLPDLGETGSVVFRRVEELVLDGCGLSDEVNVGAHRDGTDEGAEEKRTKAPVLEIIAKIFPNLRTLDLSNNNLTTGALSKSLLSSILLSTPSSDSGSEDGGRAGLRCLRLRLNRIEALDGFVELVKEVLGDGATTERERWKLEELDVRDNSIGKLPGELGLMPLDAFLVEGNV